MQPPAVAADTAQHNHDDAEYRAFLSRIRARFELRTDDGARPVFLTGTPATSNDSANPPNFHHIIRQFNAIRDRI